MPNTLDISSGWRWRLADAHGNAQAESLPQLKEWSPAASFPSVVHMELLARGLIPDPGIGENERLVQWVGEADWEYAVDFATPAVRDGNVIDLVLDGLDTFAAVWLNGTEILRSDNMFVPARVPVQHLLRSGEPNQLVIRFESALRVATDLERQHGARTSLMRDKRRMHTRKAQYHWGWDWGPILLTAGPYLPVRLEAYTTRIDSVHVVPDVAKDHASATVDVAVAVAGSAGTLKAEVVIADGDGQVRGSATVQLEDSGGSTRIQLAEPRLWWPNGQGEAHLHTATVRLLAGDEVLDSSSTRFGVRTVELVQRGLASGEPGTTFMFRVNGRDVFAQGANWIPCDMLLPSVTRDRYRDWVELARFAHLNMLRVWGGGVYEHDDFWDACDEMGVLVWLDCALACGDYPVHDAFVNSVAREVEAQLVRLRNRASLALVCGGNEDFMFADAAGIQYDHAELSGPFDDKPFPQRKIYLDVLPKIASRVCPSIAYWANSPFSGGAPGLAANDRTVGDLHQWSVWHEQQLPYQQYKDVGGRFVSEFGMHAFPVYRTVAHFCRGAPDAQWHPQSRLVDCHNKGHGAHTRIARYLAENFRFDMTSLPNFVYASHLLQSEAFAYALRHWKRQFRGPGAEACAGALLWQLNDVYPGTSWAFVDYFLRPKPAFYAIRRACAPLSLGADRDPDTRWIDEDRPRTAAEATPSFDLWAHNTDSKSVDAVLRLRAYDFADGSWTPLPAGDAERTVHLEGGRSTELGRLESQPAWTADSAVILEMTLADAASGAELAQFVDWPEPYRYLYWPRDTAVSVRTARGDGQWEDRVVVSSNQPLKGVWLEPVYDGQEKDGDREPLWEDNMLDLMPGGEMSVGVNGLRGRGVSARFLGDWEIA